MLWKYKKCYQETSENIVIQQGNFGYSEDSAIVACSNICSSTDLVLVYRNALFGSFFFATKLALDSNLSIPAPAGYYSEFDISNGASIVRYWNGTAFTGLPEICGC